MVMQFEAVSICLDVFGADMSSLGEKMAALRKAHELNMTELAELVGVTRGTISHIERGHAKPSVEVLKKIARVFKISPGLLLDDSLNVEKLAEMSLVLSAASQLSEKNLKILLTLAESLQDA